MQQKIHFECDYTEGAHPKILKRFMETNMEQTVGYGEDPYCQKAAELIRGLCKKRGGGSPFSCRGNAGKSDSDFSAPSPASGGSVRGNRTH